MYTPYHSKYWAAALTCKGAARSIDSLSRSIAGTKVDLKALHLGREGVCVSRAGSGTSVGIIEHNATCIRGLADVPCWS